MMDDICDFGAFTLIYKYRIAVVAIMDNICEDRMNIGDYRAVLSICKVELR